MARPLKTDRPISRTINFPQTMSNRLDLELFSEVEGRIPHGRLSEFVVACVQAKLDEMDAVHRQTKQSEQ